MSAQENPSSPDGGPADDIIDHSAALSGEAATWLLHRLLDDGDMTLRELSLAFGSDARNWLTVGKLLRARYIVEGDTGLAATERGARALERFETAQANEAVADDCLDNVQLSA